MSDNNEPQEAIENDDLPESLEYDELSEAENQPEEPAPSQQKSKKKSESNGELIKFGILAIILIGSVLVVAISRPLIFGRIVPAVMGDTGTDTPATVVEEPAASEDIVIPTDNAEPTGEEGVGGQEDPNVGGGVPTTDSGYPAPAEDSAPPVEDTSAPVEDPAAIDNMPTAVPSIIHTVQAGENLVRIAAQYGATVETIIAINNIANPDQVAVGTELIIPQP